MLLILPSCFWLISILYGLLNKHNYLILMWLNLSLFSIIICRFVCVPCLRELLYSSSLDISFIFSSKLMEISMYDLEEFHHLLRITSIQGTHNKFTIFLLMYNSTLDFYIFVGLPINFLCPQLIYLSVLQTGP